MSNFCCWYWLVSFLSRRRFVLLVGIIWQNYRNNTTQTCLIIRFFLVCNDKSFLFKCTIGTFYFFHWMICFLFCYFRANKWSLRVSVYSPTVVRLQAYQICWVPHWYWVSLLHVHFITVRAIDNMEDELGFNFLPLICMSTLFVYFNWQISWQEWWI